MFIEISASKNQKILYALSYLAEHLNRSENNNELYNLVKSQEWHRLSTEFDPSRQQYRQDIEWAYRAAKSVIEIALQTNNHSELEKPLVHLAAISWIFARLGQFASLLSPCLLESLTRLAQGEQAVHRAMMIPNAVGRARALIQIGNGAFNTHQPVFAQNIWKNALELLRVTPSDFLNEKFETMGRLIVVLARAGLLDRAIVLTKELENELRAEQIHSGGVTSIALKALTIAWAVVGETEQAKNIAREINSADQQLLALCEAAKENMLKTGIVDSLLFESAKNLVTVNVSKAGLKQFAELLAYQGRVREALRLYGSDLDNESRVWAYQAAAVFAAAKGHQGEIEKYYRMAIAEIFSENHVGKRLQMFTNLVIDGNTEHVVFPIPGEISQIYSDFDLHFQKLDKYALGSCALAFSLLGNEVLAQKAVTAALTPDSNIDDWDETYTLLTFARQFGQTGNNSKLRAVMGRGNQHTDPWQCAEIMLAISEAALITSDKDLLNEALEKLYGIALDESVLSKRPNALGALAVWYAKQNPNDQNTEVYTVIQKALKYLKHSHDDADGIAYLGLTLAQNDLLYWSRYVIEFTTELLEQERDPNIVARVIGTASQVAGSLKNLQTLQKLHKIALKIEDEWLRAEALFWIAGWQAILGNQSIGKKLFLKAVEFGAWEQISPKLIESAWTDPQQANLFISASDYIGWPSTKVAEIFATLAILLAHPKHWHLQFGLKALETIPAEYSEKRALCLELIVGAARTLKTPSHEIIGLYVQALQLSRDRHPGEIWAVLRACLPHLTDFFGIKWLQYLWDEIDKGWSLML